MDGGRELLTGGVLMVGGVAMFVTALGFPVIPAMAYGPGLFPKIVAVGLFLSGAGIATEGIVGRGAALKERLEVLPILLLAALIVAFILALPWLGFHIAGTLVLIGAILIFRGSWLTAIVFAPIATVLVHMLFYNVLRVPLPWGLLLPIAW
ncbi:tripartite tricarboxylate transporter TctB family protein [Oceaniglobus roseus]|uniref:tripartite tricarboxylate transporter TctB family protein n=1 Tax=Oceaniglobus roseus TaxID=1737570 RepID=UPI000C7E9FAB|nr:tripartite tricarboxylate transporter TctB family protein [Kandeliimicrobium roseum]